MSLPPSYNEFNYYEEPFDPLPSYTTGAEVRQVSNLPQNAASMPLRIVLSPECRARRSFDLGDIVLGHLVVTPRTPIQLSQLAVSISYEEVVKQHSWVSDTITKKYGRVGEYFVPKASFPGGFNGDAMLLPGMEYSFPFAVQIPELQTPDNCKHNSSERNALLHLRLPPSIGSPPERNIIADNIEDNDVRINYKLIATAQSIESIDQPLFQAVEHIHIVPSYTVSPKDLAKVTTDHSYAKEFELRPREILRKTMFRGTVDLALSRFAALSMYTPLMTTLTVTAAPKTVGLPPPAITKIFVKLTGFTAYLNEEPKRHTSGIVTLLGPSMTMTPWISLADGKMTTQIGVPVKLPQSKLITPTFESCIVSRWYTLTVSVVLQDHSIMMLEVPVNVVGEACARSAAPYNSTDIPAPTYQQPHTNNGNGNNSYNGRRSDQSDWIQNSDSTTNGRSFISQQQQQQRYQGPYSQNSYSRNKSFPKEYRNDSDWKPTSNINMNIV